MTPKAPPHIGHARLFVHADVFRRYVEHRGFNIRHVQNFTDIDDKIIERAREQGRDPLELSKANSEAYFEVMDRLNILRAHIFPKVTEHIEAIIKEIAKLIDRGYAYSTSNGVYFEVAKWPRYGILSGRTSEDEKAGVRIEVDSQKHNPRDFALWKSHKEGELYWDSPWGRGRPGWHIECSSMIKQHLGPRIDVHWGGSDLLFPHHENELAQAEAGFETEPFVKHWLHVGVLRVNGEKMGHSTGNFLTLETLLKQFSPQIVRLYLLSTPYRSVVDFTEDSLNQSTSAYNRLLGAFRASPAEGESDPDPDSVNRLQNAVLTTREGFESALDDDLNTAGGIAALFDLVKAINSEATTASKAAVDNAKEELISLSGILGLDLVEKPQSDKTIGPLIDLLLDVREELRNEKLWTLSDMIRDRLQSLNITIEDGPDRTTWR
jgi:cysteinyl-tRNA synthetase